MRHQHLLLSLLLWLHCGQHLLLSLLSLLLLVWLHCVPQAATWLVQAPAASTCLTLESNAYSTYAAVSAAVSAAVAAFCVLAGGYMVGAGTSCKYLFDLRPGDVYWCTADCGWITGHTYLTYGPMLNGVTQVLFGSTPAYPDAGRCWRIVEKYDVSVEGGAERHCSVLCVFFGGGASVLAHCGEV
jgi:hypothetical protein